MATYKVNRQGNCPYCESGELVHVEDRRPDQEVVRCTACDEKSVRRPSNFVYPMPDSQPAVATS